MEERWAKIEGFPRYSVSDAGCIRNDKTGRILKCAMNVSGYAVVTLRKPDDGAQKTLLVHIIVCRAFIENPKDLPVINHLDGDKMNPAAYNLEWTTYSGNSRHAADVLGTLSGSRPHARPVLQLEPLRLFDSIAQAARAIGTTPREIRRCIEHPDRNYTSHGYRFIDAAVSTTKGVFLSC